ncbi:uncharacterized protein [Diadema setosum]|uniref:uncharacterized protein n=1 Tax=Diadema setosum TaxID=31175 RepID=UPI003B3AA777
MVFYCVEPVSSTGGEEINPEERDNHFDRIVQPPEKVDLVTGEEGEVAVFSARGRLYYFHSASRSWKERGVGDIKIMHAPKSDAYRVVMRRDQVNTICANHYITKAMTMLPTLDSDRAWVWHAMDTSDGEGVSEQLAIRFEESTTAVSFKEAFERAQEALRQKAGDAEQETATTSTAEGASTNMASKAADGATATESSQGDDPNTPEVRSCDPIPTSGLTDAPRALSPTREAAGSPSSAEAGVNKPGDDPNSLEVRSCDMISTSGLTDAPRALSPTREAAESPSSAEAGVNKPDYYYEEEEEEGEEVEVEDDEDDDDNGYEYEEDCGGQEDSDFVLEDIEVDSSDDTGDEDHKKPGPSKWNRIGDIFANWGKREDSGSSPLSSRTSSPPSSRTSSPPNSSSSS